MSEIQLVRPRFAGPCMVAVTLLVMTVAFGPHFADGVFFLPLSDRLPAPIRARRTA